MVHETMTADREEIARRYGFNSYAELLDISDTLPLMDGDAARSYMAHHPKGHWFIWQDLPRAEYDDPSDGSATGPGLD